MCVQVGSPPCVIRDHAEVCVHEKDKTNSKNHQPEPELVLSGQVLQHVLWRSCKCVRVPVTQTDWLSETRSQLEKSGGSLATMPTVVSALTWFSSKGKVLRRKKQENSLSQCIWSWPHSLVCTYGLAPGSLLSGSYVLQPPGGPHLQHPQELVGGAVLAFTGHWGAWEGRWCSWRESMECTESSCPTPSCAEWQILSCTHAGRCRPWPACHCPLSISSHW
jgi:hypothetical protein